MSRLFYFLVAMALVLAFMDPVIAQDVTTQPGPPMTTETEAVIYLAQVDTGDLVPVVLDPVPLPPEEAPWWTGGLKTLLGTFPEINAWLVAVLVFFNGLSRVLAEGLMFVAQKTDTKKDDRWASILQRVSLWFATLLGWFSLGTPKKLTDKKDKLT